MVKRRHRRPDRTDTKDSFCRLDHKFIDDPRFKALSPTETRVLLVLFRKHNGINNGSIAMPSRAGEDWGLSKDATARALRGLVRAGFIAVAKPSSFNLKSKRAAEYRLRWLPEFDEARNPIVMPDFFQHRFGHQVEPSEKNTVAPARQIAASQSRC